MMHADIDECSQSHRCENGDCVNTEPGFYCVCHEGYISKANKTECVGKPCMIVALAQV